MTFDLKSVVVRILGTVGNTVSAGFVLNADVSSLPALTSSTMQAVAPKKR